MNIAAESATRVMDQTDQDINERIALQTQANIAYFAGHPEGIDGRLMELDQEWDIERWLQINSAILSFTGLFLGLTRSRAWLLLPLTVQSFFLQHGLQGWCPPLPIFRRMGVRTQLEIQTERFALKALRGDFDNARSAPAAFAAAER